MLITRVLVSVLDCLLYICLLVSPTLIVAVRRTWRGGIESRSESDDEVNSPFCYKVGG